MEDIVEVILADNWQTLGIPYIPKTQPKITISGFYPELLSDILESISSVDKFSDNC